MLGLMARRHLADREVVTIGNPWAMMTLVVDVEKCHSSGLPARTKQLLGAVARPRDLADCWVELASCAVMNVLVRQRENCAVFCELATTL
jgi:hypothetical protein